jgi:hypothetical protein
MYIFPLGSEKQAANKVRIPQTAKQVKGSKLQRIRKIEREGRVSNLTAVYSITVTKPARSAVKSNGSKLTDMREKWNGQCDKAMRLSTRTEGMSRAEHETGSR